nr:transposase [uncultured Prevotella sp.]
MGRQIGVLTDLKARGVQDILITCTNNLNGFTDTIRTIFPQSSPKEICVVHLTEALVSDCFLPIPAGNKQIIYTTIFCKQNPDARRNLQLNPVYIYTKFWTVSKKYETQT